MTNPIYVNIEGTTNPVKNFLKGWHQTSHVKMCQTLEHQSHTNTVEPPFGDPHNMYFSPIGTIDVRLGFPFPSMCGT